MLRKMQDSPFPETRAPSTAWLILYCYVLGRNGSLTANEQCRRPEGTCQPGLGPAVSPGDMAPKGDHLGEVGRRPDSFRCERCCFVQPGASLLLCEVHRRSATSRPAFLGTEDPGRRTSDAEPGEAQADRTAGPSAKDRRHFPPCGLDHLSLRVLVRWKVFLVMQLRCGPTPWGKLSPALRLSGWPPGLSLAVP